MPTYEYRCKDCGHTFDAYQSFTDDALTECPECKGALKKLFGNVGISFKGSGFYKTDSRAGAKTGSTTPSTAEPATTGSDGSGSSTSDGKGTKGSDSSSSTSSTDKGSKDSGSSTKTATPASSSK